MYIPNPVIHLTPRDPSFNQTQSRTIAGVVCIIVAAVLIIGLWCTSKLWGSRARNRRAEQDLGVRALPGMRNQPEEWLPVYDASGSPLGMPPPAYLPADALGRETYRRDGISRELGSIEEKDEPVDNVKRDESGECKERKASV